jgi:hypothetical protein
MTRFAISELIHFKGDKHHSHYFRGRLNNAVAGQGQRMKDCTPIFRTLNPDSLITAPLGVFLEPYTNP